MPGSASVQDRKQCVVKPDVRLELGMSLPAMAPAAAAQVGRRERKCTIAELSVQGILPKARRPFALYTQHRFSGLDAGVRPKDFMKRVGADWRALCNVERQEWKDLSAEEFDKRRQLAKGLGVDVKNKKKQPIRTGEAAALAESAGASMVASAGALPLVSSIRRPSPGPVPKQDVAMVKQDGRVPVQDAKVKREELVPLQDAAKEAQGCASTPGSSEESGLSRKVSVTWLGRYRVENGRRLRSGSYGAVVVVQHGVAGRLYAAKIFYDKAQSCQDELRVYEALRRHPCPAFAALHDSHVDAALSWIVMDLLPCPTVRQRCKLCRFNSEELRALSMQCVQAISHLHQKVGYLHLDVKTTNMLWCDQIRHAHLVDFSLSVRWPLTDSQGVVACTAHYRPPELWPPADKCHKPAAGPRGDRVAAAQGKIFPGTDAYSLGCCICEAAMGGQLFVPRPSIAAMEKYAQLYESYGSWQLCAELDEVPVPLRSFLWGLVDPAPARRHRHWLKCLATNAMHNVLQMPS